MLTPVRRQPRGASLVELLVALALAAIVLASATSSVLRQQRTTSALGGATARAAQLRAATGALAAELSALGAASGDLVAGEARDTALQLRTVVADDVACGDGAGSVTFAGSSADSAIAPSGAEPRVGDTLWWYGEADRRWLGKPITASDSVTTSCLLTGTAARPLRRVVAAATDTIQVGAPVRVTRPARYSFYRSGDGSWQLGLREWVESNGAFASPQPIAGPFVLDADGDRSGFRYFDVDGGELAVGPAGADVARVARLRITVLAAPHRDPGRAIIGRDSVDVALHRARAP